MNYIQHFQTRVTPQSEPIPGKTMVANNAGGYVFQADDWKRLDRFLILGSQGGIYYVGEKELTVHNAEIVHKLLQSDGQRVVNRIVEISHAGRAPKNDQALFALAMAAGLGDKVTRKLALSNLSKVARIGTHLFQFLEYVEGFRGWGRGLREAIQAWYTERKPEDLVYQLIKYQQRGGWSHRDALRLAHPKSDTLNDIFKWVTKGEYTDGLPELLDMFDLAHKAVSEAVVVDIIKNTPRLPWEAIPTQWLASPNVWKALLPNLPLTALIRNLGRMTANGALKPMSDELLLVAQRLSNQEALAKARIHPMNVLVALKTYELGRGVKGSLTWPPLHPIVDALDKAFYLCFGNVTPTNKRILFAIDASGSMRYLVNGAPNINCREASVALALVNAVVEPVYHCIGFTEGDHVFSLPLSANMRLDDAMRGLERYVRGSGTDCALPLKYALRNNVSVDAFVVLTDGETWAGPQHPTQALAEYRRKVNPQAKFIVQAMAANHCSIADPNDFLSLDVAGFDTTTPQVISDFVAES